MEKNRSGLSARTIGKGILIVIACWLFIALVGRIMFSGESQPQQAAQNAAGAAQPNLMAQRTLVFWDSMARINADLRSASTATKPDDLKAQSAMARQSAKEIAGLPTADVDPEAVAFSKEYTDITLGMAHFVDKMPTGVAGVLTAVGMALDVGGTVSSLREETMSLKHRFEKLDLEHHRLRKSLSAKYGMEFRALWPPVSVVLTPFLIYDGYYVVVTNTSTSQSVDVSLAYSDGNGKRTYQRVGTVEPNSITKVDPSKVNWTIKRGDSIEVEIVGGDYRHTHRVNDLLPR